VCKLQLFIFLFVENLFTQMGVQIGSRAKSISYSCVHNAHVHVQRYKHYSLQHVHVQKYKHYSCYIVLS